MGRRDSNVISGAAGSICCGSGKLFGAMQNSSAVVISLEFWWVADNGRYLEIVGRREMKGELWRDVNDDPLPSQVRSFFAQYLGAVLR